ncbi:MULTISPECIES: dynamin-like GTPase family protein [Trichocoleus]|uniref:Dynamin-like GTPase family protein n=1 Tax=Trichocoleus desertorum GB2-A4 TaxID=2933944 RepID=A0ABV0J8R8_9CYAN|nr:dynamin-like GTPase family protein [Trichocoleus sp. FACHB-46]MBD1861182.1 dynamin-like GTPase family protein [Trichocoleus sp. FACHB-46]
MTQMPLQCQSLPDQVDSLLQLLHHEPSLRTQQDITVIQSSLKKAIAPKFQIVFAGAFSAGKSMLINALLERELLYSAEGHATGTECYVEYAEPDQERVVLTFLSEAEIREQAQALCQRLGLTAAIAIDQPEVMGLLHQGCQAIIQQEGGESKSERAKQAKALILLMEGFMANRDRLHPTNHATYSMEQFNFSSLKEAASFARRGSNSSVLRRIEYYCHHPLLQDGNVLVDMPGIDAPVKKDAELTYRKIEDSDTSAVVCVLKPAAAGDMTTEETELLEKMRSNIGIRDRVFYVFNRIDETWYNSQLRQRLDDLVYAQFQDSSRVYKTSGLLGFYGSQIKQTRVGDRFGLDSVFAESIKGLDGQEETPQFVNEFNRYCANSGKLASSRFRISVNSYETPNENYVRILQESGAPLVEQLIQDSGIEEFRTAITRYLTEEKRPQLFANLADDLQPLCINLRNHYLAARRELDSQPRAIDAMKARELEHLGHELKQIGADFSQAIAQEVNAIAGDVTNATFEAAFIRLKARMVSRLDELLNTFSVADAYSRATLSHPRNATAPLMAILVEAFYYLANELETVLVEASQAVVVAFFQYLTEQVRKSDYYRKLYRLLGNDGGIEAQLKHLEAQVRHAIANQARIECDRYVRETPQFFGDSPFFFQLRQTLQQTSQGYDCESMAEAEPAIRQLLKLDFEPKVSATIRRNFRQTLNQTLKTHLLPMAEQQADAIFQQYDHARAYLEQTLEKEAEEKILRNQRLLTEVDHNIATYNQAVEAINSCLQAMQLRDRQLPFISTPDLDQTVPAAYNSETFDFGSSNGTQTSVTETNANLA